MFYPDSENYQTSVDQDDLDTAEDFFCKERVPFGCRDEFADLIHLIMRENNLSIPTSVDKALQLYLTLLTEMQAIL